ncbi:MAG TPA: serine/threonine-protein kinase [Kofleriaceae bacterium]|jgi:serine/threonine-protein kinase|nr:serine/threonine-protein kinase [Kofleriaceae bacterium]
MATGPKAPKASEAPPLAVKIGDVVLDRYRIVEQIASGGHSVVFRGQDERLSRPVCIKVFSGMGGNSGVGRTSYEHFVQEAFALSRLTHPNTLRIFDFGHLGPKDAEGMPLQVCEYMNGGTLSHVVREQGRQSLAETVRVINAMCLALAEAHALGIVHRDIKPQNILFGAVAGSRLPKLADFGIAKWSADDDNRDQRAEDTAIVAGQKLAMYSPSWAAPEQLAGQPVSPATDIYSLACVAVYMLSGNAIFADEDVYAGYRKRRRGGDLVAAALQPLDVPAPVIEVLSKAVAFDPRHRVERVDDLARQLTAALESPPPEARPAESPMATPPAPPAAPAAPQQTAPAPQQPAPRLDPTPSPQPLPPPPGGWAPPPAASPWMARAPAPQGAPHRLPLSDLPQVVGDRRVHYLHAPNLVADLIGSHNSKVRVTFLSGPTGARVLHLKGLTCFVALLGGRPSPAVQIDQAGDIALVTPRAQEIGHIRVATGTPGAGHAVFPVGGELVSIRTDDCIDAILFDFGPGSEAYFVYTRGRPIPKSRRG